MATVRRPPGQVATGCATCRAAAARPAGPPCDIQQVVFKCTHCGVAGKRGGFPELKVYLDPKGVRRHNLANRRIDWSVFMVTASSRAGYEDAVSLAITMAARPHPARHPMVTFSPPREEPVVKYGANMTLRVRYPAGWWRRVLPGGGRQTGIDVLRSLFFPAPDRYAVLIQSCGVRAGPRFGALRMTVEVYPDDVFELSLSLPASRTTKRKRQGGQLTPPSPAEKETYAKKVNDSFSFSHNSADITKEVAVTTFVRRVLAAREAILTFVDFIEEFSRRMPKVGWSASFELQFLSGSFALEWGYKESAADPRVLRAWKLSANLTLVQAKAEVSFGAEVFGATARVFGSIQGTVTFAGAWSSVSSGNSVALGGKIEGTLGAEGALGDVVKLKAQLKAGIKVEGKVKLSPFQWSLGAKRTEATAAWEVEVLFGAFKRKGSYTLWEEAPLLAPTTLI